MDYKAAGFRCGLEIHQQLDTKRKLFCHCPVGLQQIAPDARIVRQMRPTLSEMGEYDRTALMEFRTKKQVIYELYRESTCSYEMDDTPPFPINQQAIDIVIEIALLLNCKLVDEIHVTRKQYLDGSIPTGFQRTAAIGVDGSIPFLGRQLSITQVNIEEDSCREVSDRGHLIRWKTDRLSTPLIEIITDHQLTSPKEVMQAAQVLRELTRLTGKVRRGRGSGRQDVNVSVTGCGRVEIKGVAAIRKIAALTHYEACRQQALLKLKDWLLQRIPEAQPPHSVHYFNEDLPSGCRQLMSVDDGEQQAAVMVLKELRGLFSFPLAAGRTFFHEISDRLRVIACLDSPRPFQVMEHAGAQAHETSAWNDLAKLSKCQEKDSLVLIIGPSEDLKTATEEILTRVWEATQGVPEETRQVWSDGTTGFERVLPGPDRMYPDTDSPPTVLTQERTEGIKAQLPPRPWELRKSYQDQGLSEHLISRLILSRLRPLYDQFVAQESRPSRLAHFIVDQVPAVQRRSKSQVTLRAVEAALRWYMQGTCTMEALPMIVERLASLESSERADELQAKVWQSQKIDFDALLDEVWSSRHEHRSGETRALFDFLMGKLMQKSRGSIPAKKMVDSLRQRLS